MKYGYNEAQWRQNLWIRNQDTGYVLTPHDKYPKMYWLIRPDGSPQDFYNLTRAKDNAVKLAINELNKDARSDLEGRT